MFFVFAWYINVGARGGIFEAIRFELLVGWFLLLVCIGLLAIRPINMNHSKSIVFSIVILLFFIVVQLPFAADPVRAKFFFQDRVIKFAMMAIYIVVLVRSPRTSLWFILAFLFACFYITQESVQGLISGGLYWQNQGIMRLHGSVKMYVHPNSLAGLAMGVIPFVVYLFPVLRNKIIRIGLAMVFSTSLICVIYSGSRTAYVAILAFALYWWLVSSQKIKFLFIGLVVFIVGYAVIPQQYLQRLESISGEEASGHSKETRIIILEDAWAIFLENPQGVGVASFPAVRRARFGRFQDTHNLYLEVATNLGIQGLLSFSIYIVILFRALLHLKRDLSKQKESLSRAYYKVSVGPGLKRLLSKQISDLDLVIGVIKAVLGFIFVRLVLGFFGMDLYEIYWWFAGGLAISLLNFQATLSSKSEWLQNVLGEQPARKIS